MSITKNFLFNIFLIIFTFLITNIRAIAINELNKLYIFECFCFFVCKNYNLEATLLAMSIPVIMLFLFNI